MEIPEIESQIEAYENSKRVVVYADEQTAKRLGIKVGEPYTIFPPPKNKEEAFDRLENYLGKRYLVSRIKIFNKIFPRNLRTLSDELKGLNDFINEADKISTVEAFEPVNVNPSNVLKYEYLKWKYGYYKNENLEFYTSPSFISAHLMIVYGTYFLYKEWLEKQIISLRPKLRHHEPVPKSDPNFKITPFEKIKRELITIHWIFTSQFMTKSKDMTVPIIHEDGRYCSYINIRSNQPLIHIEEYKLHFTERFERAKNNVSVVNELIMIYNKANSLLDYYNENLTLNNPIVKEYYDSFSDNEFITPEIRSERLMRVVVDYYYPQDILFGENTLINDHQSKWTMREFNYDATNLQLAEFCINLIVYIDTFEIPALKSKGTEENMTINDDLEVEIAHRSENPFLFESNQSAELNNKHPKHNPNMWNAKCYELFKYLFDNYYTNTKRQLTNIWFFLKENRNDELYFYATKDTYKSFILSEYGVKITNVDKSENKWDEKDLPKLREHYQNFKEHVKNT